MSDLPVEMNPIYEVCNHFWDFVLESVTHIDITSGVLKVGRPNWKYDLSIHFEFWREDGTIYNDKISTTFFNDVFSDQWITLPITMDKVFNVKRFTMLIIVYDITCQTVELQAINSTQPVQISTENRISLLTESGKSLIIELTDQ